MISKEYNFYYYEKYRPQIIEYYDDGTYLYKWSHNDDRALRIETWIIKNNIELDENFYIKNYSDRLAFDMIFN